MSVLKLIIVVLLSKWDTARFEKTTIPPQFIQPFPPSPPYPPDVPTWIEKAPGNESNLFLLLDTDSLNQEGKRIKRGTICVVH